MVFMRPEMLNSVLRCPTCQRHIEIADPDDAEFVCECGAGFAIASGVLDFHAEEQTFANNWSQTASEEEVVRQRNGWIERGPITADDFVHSDEDIRADEIRAAMDEGKSVVRAKMLSASAPLVMDMCTGRGGFFDDDIKSCSAPDKLIMATDLSRPVLLSLSERIGVDGPTAYIACDNRRLPIRDNSVDLVTGLAAFGNVEEGSKLLSEAGRVLVPGGELMLLELCPIEGTRTIRWVDEVLFPDNLMTKERLMGAMRASGFANVGARILFSGVGHMEGDLLPLRGDTTEVALISATRAR
jgi:ubiquinone/menaquinone biosynthesis C-methylase UbiE